MNGQQYTSDHLLPPAERVKGPTDYMEFETREAAEEELNFYGGRPTVYYRDSPSKAFLDGPQFSMGSAVGSLVGTLFGLPFLAFGYFLVRWGTGDDEEQAEEAGEAMEGIAEGVESDHDADADDEWGSSDFDGGGGLFDGGGDGGGGFGGDGDGGGGGGGGGVE